MTCPKLSFKDLKGTSRLFIDFLYQFQKVAPYYCADFRDTDRFRANAGRLAARDFNRSELSEILTEQNRHYGLGAKTFSNLEKFKNNTTCAVFTGQQVGLLTGPIYTIYKTLTAIKLAEFLKSEIGAEVIPLFWLATDDHDFEEVRHVHILDKSGKPEKIDYRPKTQPDNIPLGFLKCDGEIEKFVNEVIDALPHTEYTDISAEMAHEAYRPGVSFADAFGQMLGRIFADSGLIIVNPADIRIKQLSAPIYKKEIEEFQSSNQIISLANAELDKLGYHLQVNHLEDYLNLFYYTGKRARIGFKDGAFFIDGIDRQYSREELLEAADQLPAFFSPNVLMRPVVQDYLFPTLAYIAGPAEAAYYAQIKHLHNHFNVQCPIVFPRMSATILDKASQKTIERYDLMLSEMIDDKSLQASINAVVSTQVPEELLDKLERKREEITSSILEIDNYLEDLDEGVRKTVQKTKGKIEYELKSMQDKIIKAYKKKNDDIVAAVNRTADFLFPEASLQERHLNILTFINKYGPDFVGRISEHLKLDVYDHQIICLDETGY